MGTKAQLEVAGQVLQVSNLEKVLFPGNKFTKADVINYYIRAGKFILPHLKDRPLTLKRYPEGVTGEHFYEKKAPSHAPEWVETAPVARRGGGPDINFVLINNLPTLVWAANLASLEMHVFLARAKQLDRPDFLVVDLDPGEPANVIQAAQVGIFVRELLKLLKLESFIKVSGSKGCQLYVPLNTRVTYAETEPFAKALAERLEQERPELIVSEMAKNLRAGKVFIDWSQNVDYKTTACVYTLRAKREQPFVSVPLTWEEVIRAVDRNDPDALFFEPDEALKRMEKLGDLFAPTLKLKQRLPSLASLATVKLATKPVMKSSAKNTATKAAAPKRAAQSKASGNSDTSHDGSLKEYDAKRDFTQTAEPGPDRKESDEAGELMFVIQKHHASHLHYDFRLEMDGVLKSWAVPKGPPFTPAERRLAMHVEDHPMSYARFEGTIPAGNYGAGTVMVWDIGRYRVVEGKPLQAYHQGKIKMAMRGEKMKGEWTLVRSSRADASGKQPWYLLKTGEPAEPVEADFRDRSVLTRRTLDEITHANDAQWESNRSSANGSSKPAMAEKKSAAESKKAAASTARVRPPAAAQAAAPAAAPAFVEPMKAKLIATLPEGENWKYEVKFDGFRALAVKNGGSVDLLSRNANSFNSDFPEVVRELKALPFKKGALDGEVVAVDSKGKVSFQALQGSGSHSGFTIHYYVFDLLNLEGKSLLKVSLKERKDLLEKLIRSGASKHIHFSGFLEARPAELIKAALEKGMEGIIAKRSDSIYESGDRSGAWVKYKTNQEQELVVGGWRPTGTKSEFDAIYVGYYEANGDFRYVAKVRAGFTPMLKRKLMEAAKGHHMDKPPFDHLKVSKAARFSEGITVEDLKSSVWLKPKVVAQIEFVEWTANGNLRHPKYKGLRVDKEAREVRRETSE